MLTVQHISEILSRVGALPVHQVAILDFLNRAVKPEDIAGPEGSSVGPIKDDPRKFTGGRKTGKGYDVGVKVAQRILDRREELGGRFSRLEDLARISYFGEDKFHDLVYTFVWHNSPVPTGMGPEFDEYISALAVLELGQLKEGGNNKEVVSAVRKLNLDTSAPNESASNMNWNDVIPAAREVQIPSSWSKNSDQVRSVNTIRTLKNVKVRQDSLDAPILLAGLDARNNRSAVTSGNSALEVSSNFEFATFLQGIANATHKYINGFGSQPVQVEAEGLTRAYLESYPLGALMASADANAMDYDEEHSLSWNVVRYYTTPAGPIRRRFVNLSEQVGLGEWKDGIFQGDTPAFREEMTNQAMNAAFRILSENGGGSQVDNMVSQAESDPLYTNYRLATAYLTDKFITEMNLRVSMELYQPAILSWNRLEGRPRTKNLDRALRAEVRDPLWFISRQWQIGEFEGEDTGSSVEMRVDMETVPVNRYSLRKGTARDYDGQVPIETAVEREVIDIDMTLSQEIGRHWEKLVRKELLKPTAYSASAIDAVIAEFKSVVALQFALPTPAASHPGVHSDNSLVRLYAAIGNGRMLNGGALYTALKSGTTAHSFLGSPSADLITRLGLAKTALLNWFSKIYNEPVDSSDDAWAPSQLEYQFQCSAPKNSSQRTVLTADEYAQGRMDWYSFDIETDDDESDVSLRSNGSDSNLIERRTVTVLPGDLRFPGMPLARWWEFEDWKVNLGDIVADTTDVAKLLQAEFALIYGNDWMLLPHDVKVGSICDIQSVVVRDVFGQYTMVNAAGAGDNTDWERWTMFNLHRRNFTSGAADTRLFVPPAVIKTMESETLEQVTFLRDEMANMVWGIESTIPDGRGGGQDGTEAATALYKYLESIAPPTTPPPPIVPNTADVEYKLGTSVPENWIPFIPVRKGNLSSRQIQLRRAAMPRLIPGTTPERIRPRTDLLKEGYNPVANTWSAYFIFEEEVPRSGAIVTRNWQRTRGMNGEVFTWLGRRKQNGRGEVNSGLEYDILEDRT